MFISRLLIAWLIALFAATAAHAQSTLPLAKAAQITQTTNCFPTQFTGAITPAIQVECLTSIINSYQQFAAVNSQVGTTYAVVATDYGKVVTFKNSSAIAVSIPAAAGSFLPFNVYLQNLGVGTVTVTPASGTIGGNATLVLTTNQQAWLVADGTGTNYTVLNSPSSITVTCGGLPALTGDVTSSATSCATTVAKIQGTVVSGTSGTGNVAFTTSPVFTTPSLGFATAINLSMSGSLTYGGVVLSNAVTGTGSMVLSASPTFTGTLAFAALSPTSIGADTAIISGLALNNSPIAASDYLMYFSSANGAINKATIASIASAGIAGVSSLNGLTGGLSVVQGGPITVAAAGSSVTLGFTTGAGAVVESATLYQEQMPIGGRVTLISGTCIASTDQAAQTTIYYAPCSGGKYLPIYDGTAMKLQQFTSSDTDQVGLSIALGSSWAANTIFDLYVTINGGLVTPCTVAWSSGSARATAVTQYKGVEVNNASMTCRTTNSATITVGQYQGTLVGWFRTNSSTGTVDLKFGTNASGGGAACICIGNVYNQVQATASVGDTTATWTYTSATFEQANNSAGNQINVVQGLASQPIGVTVTNMASNSGTNGVFATGGIGIDSTTADSSQNNIAAENVVTGKFAPATASYSGVLAVGFHNINRLEQSQAVGTETWIGATAGAQTGIRASFWY